MSGQRAAKRQHVRHHARGDALEGPDAQHPAPRPAERLDVAARLAEPAQDEAAVPEQHLAGVGQRDLPATRAAPDQAPADDPLERGELLADRRLRVAEPVRGAPERALLGDRLERLQVPHREASPARARHPAEARYAARTARSNRPVGRKTGMWSDEAAIRSAAPVRAPGSRRGRRACTALLRSGSVAPEGPWPNLPVCERPP